MSDAGARIMGGMTKKESREVIERLTGKKPTSNAMRTVRRLGTEFTVREDPKEIERFLASIDDDGETLPERIITDENDGANGLWWQSFEQFWVELGCGPEQLNPEILLHELQWWIAANVKK